MADASDVETLYRDLLDRWNDADAAGYGELFTADGSMVGYDGTFVESAVTIAGHLRSIFADHQPPTYVAKVRAIRQLGPGTSLLLSVVGMVPPGQSDVNPETNAMQALLAVETSDGLRVAHFQNTPAALHGRPDEVDDLTAELRAVLASDD